MTSDLQIRKSLHGVGVVITRPETDTAPFARLLQVRGAIPILFPIIELTRTLLSYPELFCKSVRQTQVLVFTSANGVRFGVATCIEAGVTLDELNEKQIVVVGAGTQQALIDQGLRCDSVPENQTGLALVDLVKKGGLNDVLIMHGGETAHDYVGLFHAYGIQAQSYVVYRTVFAQPSGEARHVLAKGFDAITFLSASAVGGFWNALGAESSLACLRDKVVIALGSSTMQALCTCDIDHAVRAPSNGLAGVINALEYAFLPSPGHAHESLSL